jgi:hypothetical protein
MWVWSDELAARFPAIRSDKQSTLPLIAYAVERGADLEALAREVLVGSHRPPESRLRHGGVPSSSGR